MKRDFTTILADCLERLRQGQSVEECLMRYPREADALKPLLRTAVQLQNAPVNRPRPEAMREGRQRVLAKANSLQVNKTKTNPSPTLVFRLAFSVLIVLLLSGFFVVGASARSLPGDLLYGVKRGWESVRLELALSPQSRQTLEARFTQMRWDEIEEMLQKNLQGTLDVSGVLEAVNDSSWTVSGLNVQLLPKSVINGFAATGAWVTMQVQVYRDGSVILLKASFEADEGNPMHLPGVSSTPGSISTAVPGSDKDIPPATTLTPEDESTEAYEQDDDEADDDEDILEPTEEHEATDEYEATEAVEPGEGHEGTEEPEMPEEPQPNVEPTEIP